MIAALVSIDAWMFPENHRSRPPYSVTLRREVPTNVRTAPILVVDDDDSIREMVGSVLRAAGYAVHLAADGAAALDAVFEERPALVLLDARMPRLDGYGFAQELNARGVRVPILAMTAMRDAEVFAQRIRADGYIPKPFDIDELLALVSRYIERGPH